MDQILDFSTTITDKQNHVYTVRTPNEGDAQAMLDYINTLSFERTFILLQGQQQTLAEETAFLTTKIQAMSEQRALWLLCWDKDQLVAITGIDMQAKVETHIGVLGISVAKQYRGAGLGKKLLTTIIEEGAKLLPSLEILTLSVFGENQIARSLYESMGFIPYGTLPNGIKRQEGYQDHEYLYKVIKTQS